MTGLTHALRGANPGARLRGALRGDKAVVGGLLVLALLALAALVRGGDAWRAMDLTALHEGPSMRHWFGTTGTGRDVLALTMRGLRSSLLLGLAAGLAATAVAALVGAFAGLVGGPMDRLLMAGTDLLLVLPGVLLVAVIAPQGASRGHVVFLLALLLWPLTARAVRAQTRSLRAREFVLAASYLGASRARIVLRHILPNLAGLLAADAALNVGMAILGESGLSFLGFGVAPPDVSLGTLIAEGAPVATVQPWLFLPPALVLVALTAAVNLVGNGLHRALEDR
ncbi:ABC transporter permease [Actinocorallia sp. A-T 12471]|uniref:ABC transporter permease n=1 Tax=Actinocorallia sp. A-T 12471 TaxID=3089813 RepID=UPI0029CD57E0|nr:ABC transporter permease [Actinocorallia sp. A-T 12471]MDX6743468.1 ABC transporter permease [Actinocorallia sp. A-T 12471]